MMKQGLVAWTWKTHSRFAARSQEARRTMNSAEMTSTGNGLQHPHSENDDG
jgi:hypothetical protein